MSHDLHELAAFLIEAKRRTYAGLDDDATVVDALLRGSKQLEYRADPYAYRDIYFGMGFFVGQETVSKDEKVVWSMCYSGGAQPAIVDRTELLPIYAFLRKALLAAEIQMPYRGPPSFAIGEMTYVNKAEGALDRFYGTERIIRGDLILFELRYSGGLVR